jgi:hypothetical protein
MLIAEILVRCVNFTLRAAPIRAVLAVGCVMALGACGAPSEPPAAPAELIRVGTQVVTVDDFETAFAISRIAYEYQDLKQPPVWREARLRLLGQLVEEALVREQARLLGIDVGDAEVDAAEEQIRKDYPKGAFEDLLLQQAVRYSNWRERLRVRLLMEKTARKVLGAQVQALKESDDDRAPPAEAETEQGDHSPPRLTAEAAYPQWLRRLRQEFKVEINLPEWERLLNAPPA